MAGISESRQGSATQDMGDSGFRSRFSLRPDGYHQAMKFLILLVLVVGSVFGCSRDHHDHPNLSTGEQLYNYHCAECHGEKGTGNLFEGIPANILTEKSEQGIIEYMTTGTGHERDMPVFATMPDEEARLIAEHLLTLKKTYEEGKGPQLRELLIKP